MRLQIEMLSIDVFDIRWLSNLLLVVAITSALGTLRDMKNLRRTPMIKLNSTGKKIAET